jgi:hypothetical protein
MTDNKHPITPSPELAAKWVHEIYGNPSVIPLQTPTVQVIQHAAQWGADQELEACCEWLQDPDLNVDTYKLRAARRPKPPSLKEQALLVLDDANLDAAHHNILLRALEQLDD